MVLWISCQLVGYQQWPGDQPCQNWGPVMAVPSANPAFEYASPSFSPYTSNPQPSAHILVSLDSGCLYFHPNFSCNDNTPNNSPNPSMPRCSITVFRRMGLRAEMDGGEGEDGWNELRWRVRGGGREGRKRIRGRRDCFLLPWKAADEETGTAAVGKSQIACHQPTAHWSV